MNISDSLLRLYAQHETPALHRIFSKLANLRGRLDRAKVRKKLARFLAAYYPELSFVVYDVGAAGGICPIFGPLAKLPGFKAVGFDPGKQVLPEKQADKQEVFYPIGLSGADTKRPLRITESPGCSSLLEPNHDTLREFSVATLFRQVALQDINTMTLDSFVREFHAPVPDFLKLDVQGSELEILTGCSFLSTNVAAITLETHLRELYRGEGLFPAMHVFLTERGYRLVGQGSSPHFSGEILEMDVSYVKSPAEVATAETSVKAAVFCACIGNLDYAAHLIVNSAIEGRMKNLWLRFLRRDTDDPECLQTRLLKIAVSQEADKSACA